MDYLRRLAAISLAAGALAFVACSAGGSEDVAAALARAESLLKDAGGDRDPHTRERKVRDALALLEAHARSDRRARLLLLHAMPFDPDGGPPSGAKDRQLARARAMLAADPRDGGLCGFAAALLAATGRPDEGVDLLLRHLETLDRDPASQLGVLGAINTLVSVPAARGDFEGQRRSRERLLPVARRAVEAGAAQERGGALHRTALESTVGLLTALGRVDEATAALGELEAVDPGSVVVARIQKELDELRRRTPSPGR